MKADNPFTLAFGRRPEKYIERYADTAEIVSTFSADHVISQTYLISGVRGSGKTVLMTSVVKELTETGKWISVDLNSSQDLLEDMALRLQDACARSRDLSDTDVEISFAGFGVGLYGGRSEKDSVSRIEEILEKLKKKGKRVVITVDEVSQNAGMRVFASQFQIFVRKEYPVYLIMTGLYENLYAIQNDPKLTFLLRSPKIVLSPLSLSQIANEYGSIFAISKEDACKLAAVTKGYAFAFQALGLLYWEYRENCTMDEILNKLDAMLDDFVYRKIWEGLTRIDRKIVAAMTGPGSFSVKEIRESTGITPQSFSSFRKKLLERGIVTSTGHGLLELALPRFGIAVESYVTFDEM